MLVKIILLCHNWHVPSSQTNLIGQLYISLFLIYNLMALMFFIFAISLIHFAFFCFYKLKSSIVICLIGLKIYENNRNTFLEKLLLIPRRNQFELSHYNLQLLILPYKSLDHRGYQRFFFFLFFGFNRAQLQHTS